MTPMPVRTWHSDVTPHPTTTPLTRGPSCHQQLRRCYCLPTRTRPATAPCPQVDATPLTRRSPTPSNSTFKPQPLALHDVA